MVTKELNQQNTCNQQPCRIIDWKLDGKQEKYCRLFVVCSLIGWMCKQFGVSLSDILRRTTEITAYLHTPPA